MPEDDNNNARKGLKRALETSNPRISDKPSESPFKRIRVLDDSASNDDSERQAERASDQIKNSGEENRGESAIELVENEFTDWRVNEIENGEVYYFPKFTSEKCASEWHEKLLELDAWYHPKLKVYGKEVKQSRSIAAYTSDKDLVVKYSGHSVQLHHDYPPLLLEIQKQIEDFLGEKFNHVMLNLYESGQEYIGKHRDTKENKVITSLSLGAERTFIMTPNKNNPGDSTHKWTLANGSLLVMRGKTQDNWKHEIPKEPKVKGSRISLTFRQLSTQ